MIRIYVRGDWKPVQIMAAILWPSFILAGIATMIFFAAFDPSHLGYLATFPVELSPTAGYTLGFLGFWALGIANCILALFLIRILDVDFAHQKQH